MSTPHTTEQTGGRTRFQKFRDLTRHILTTPKNEVLEHANRKPSKPGKNK